MSTPGPAAFFRASVRYPSLTQVEALLVGECWRGGAIGTFAPVISLEANISGGGYIADWENWRQNQSEALSIATLFSALADIRH